MTDPDDSIDPIAELILQSHIDGINLGVEAGISLLREKLSQMGLLTREQTRLAARLAIEQNEIEAAKFRKS